MITTTRRAARRWLAVALVVLPALGAAAAVAVMLVAGPPLDAQVVTHWGVDGPDGWGPAWTYLVGVVLVGFGVPCLAWLSMRPQRPISDSSIGVAAITLAIAAMSDIGVAVASLDQGRVEVVPAGFITGLAVGVLLGLAAWFLLPREEAEPHEEPDLPELDVPEGTVAAWTASVAAPPALLVGVGLLLAGLIALSIVSAALSGWFAWPALVVAGLVVVLLLMTAGWRINAGPAGLVVRSLLGWPVYRIAAADIRGVAPTAVDAFAEFGGWGIRWAPGGRGRRGRFGVIVRSGEAIEVQRGDGRRFVVTVRDAATGAAVLARAAKEAGAGRAETAPASDG